MFSLVYVSSIALSAIFLPVVNLPKPSDSNSVGTITMEFTQPSRKNILTKETALQKLAVQVWYPASTTAGKKRVDWMSSRKVASLFANMNKLPDLFGQLCLVKTNSYLNAPISNASEKYPIILFSSGAGMFNGQNTIQMEELASHGYVVFAVSHPYDDFATIYPDGSIIPYSSNQMSALSKDSSQAIAAAQKLFPSNEAHPDFQRAIIRNATLNTEDVQMCGDDMSFVADQIIKLNDGNIPSIFNAKLDTSQFGIFGHSFGGAASGQACLNDSRFKAFINIDGTPFGDTVDNVVQQPFMVITTGSDPNIKLKVSEGYSENQKNFLIISVDGAQHMNFTDYNAIIPSFGKSFGILGTIDVNHQTEITNTYVVSFFNKYLKETQEPLLDNTTSEYSEVNIERK